MTPRTRIDVHHHILPPPYLAALRDRINVPEHGWSPQLSLDMMDRNGIVRAYTSISAPGIFIEDRDSRRSLARICNDAAAKLAQEHSSRFGTFASVPLPDRDGAIAEINHAMESLHVDGITLMTNYGDRYLGDAYFEPVLAHLDQRKAIVFVHPTHCTCPSVDARVPISMIEYPFDTTRTILSLYISGALSRHKNIRFIFCHAGGAIPFLAHRITAMVRSRKELRDGHLPDLRTSLCQTHFDIAGGITAPMLQCLLEIVPTQNVLFGTDFPYISEARVSAMISTLSGLLPKGLERIEQENARSLFSNQTM